ncbi:uncharacterized protein LOC107636203 isoform X1 [Arachis ipaensis]|uniref:Uncharacterized protein n=1 Tax=Arachis hypogaea TaxID=3818 RepID=A0A444ZGE0_ARAHY|nr:uncharacterized protein LOC107636203 isoform X1 [Arachis ipaensis]RYR13260.1 hypothetical protein Ahy_B04g070354 isoform A [Arachis hypogaea]
MLASHRNRHPRSYPYHNNLSFVVISPRRTGFRVFCRILILTGITQSNPWPWHSLRLSSTLSSSSSSRGNSFVVSYLVGTCGFSPERAVYISKRFSFETSDKPDAVISFIKNIGLSQTTTLRVIQSLPQLLVANPKTLQPKIDFFKSKGFSSSDICRIIEGCPSILTRSLQNEIAPSFDCFDAMFQSRHKLIKAATGYSAMLYDFARYTEPNIKLLREEGVAESHIVRLIEYYPNQLKNSPKKFKEVLQEVKDMKFDPLTFQFIVAIHVKAKTGKSTWERKEGIYRKWGWTDADIIRAFRRCPWCFASSDNKIEAVMDFLVNQLGYASSSVVKYPLILSMSLKRRIIPRGSVFLVLQSKGLVRKLGLASVFRINEKTFLSKFILCQKKEADELFKLYKSKLA